MGRNPIQPIAGYPIWGRCRFASPGSEATQVALTTWVAVSGMSRTYWERECAPFTKCDATTPDFNEGVENELPPPVSAVRRLRRWPLRLGNCPLARSGGALRSRARPDRGHHGPSTGTDAKALILPRAFREPARRERGTTATPSRRARPRKKLRGKSP